jgi:gamma-glutamyl hercynylcysteine S-oxide hydrolase
MCRFVAYLGLPVTLESLLLAPEHSLLRQAWAPRFQQHGTVNADGFGAGWYDLSRRPEPAVYRSTRPIWGDRSFGSFAGLVASTAVLAVLRDATPPAVAEESGTPPFADGPWLFAHNGAVEGLVQGSGVEPRDEIIGRLRRMLSDRRLGGIRGATDSEVLFGLALDRMDSGACPGEALMSVLHTVAAIAGGRMNLVMTDGRRIAATTWGDSLYVCEGGSLGAGTRVVASEPFDDDSPWRPVPDRSLVEAGPDGICVVPIEAVHAGPANHNRRAATAADATAIGEGGAA